MFSPGDIVTIRPDLELRDYEGVNVIPDMVAMAGETHIIRSRYDGMRNSTYKLEGVQWTWSGSMFYVLKRDTDSSLIMNLYCGGY